jgi:hypothetical protein
VVLESTPGSFWKNIKIFSKKIKFLMHFSLNNGIIIDREKWELKIPF